MTRMVFDGEAVTRGLSNIANKRWLPMLRPDVHAASSSCCGDFLSDALNRLRFIQTAAAAGAALACAPGFALAATGNYEAMVLSCIDPRLQEPVRRYLVGRHLTGKYSHFVI